jgi:hypothetical protein
MRRICDCCCARATNGHAAALPSPAMNSRRRICHPLKLTLDSLSRSGLHWNGSIPPVGVICRGKLFAVREAGIDAVDGSSTGT